MDTSIESTPRLDLRIPPDVTEVRSDRWDEKLFWNLSTKTAEGPLFDRKRELPVVSCNEKKIGDAPSKAARKISNFIKDCIAMLNSARRTGRAAYIFFGVDDDWKLHGTAGQCTRDMDRDKCLEFLKSKQQFEILHRIIIEKEDLRPHTERMISESPETYIHYEFGWISHDGRPFPVSYLKFEPVATDEPFVVSNTAKEVWYDKLNLSPGTAFSRVGESNTEFAGEKLTRLPPWSRVPYISVEKWKKYASAVHRDIENSLAKEPVSDIGKQQLRCTTNNHVNDLRDLKNEVERFLEQPDEQGNTLLILGSGGSGKSMFLRDVMVQLINNLSSNLQAPAVIRSGQPSSQIPFYVDMRSFRPSLETIEEFVGKSCLRNVTDSGTSHLALNDPSLSFVCILDGIDEVAQDEQEKCIASVAKMARTYARMKFIVAARPNTIPKGDISGYSTVVRVVSLSLAQIFARIDASPQLDASIISQFKELLETRNDIKSLVSNPRMLSACLDGLLNLQDFSLGNLLEATLEGTLDAEADKLPNDLSSEQLRIDIEDLAEHWWTSKEIKYRSVQSNRSLNRLLELGILVQDGTRRQKSYRFASPLISLYFVAQRFIENNDYREEHCNQISAENAEHLEFIYIICNLIDSDLSDPDRWERLLFEQIKEPILAASIILERRRETMNDATIVKDLVERLLVLGESGAANPVSIENTIFRLANDRSDDVFSATVEALLDAPSEVTLSAEKWTKILLKEKKPTHVLQLGRLLVDRMHYDPVELLPKLLSKGDSAYELLRWLIDRSDWNEEGPMILQQTTISLDTLPPELLTFILETRHLEGKPLPQAWYMPLRIVQEKTHDADLQDRIDTAFGRLAQTDDVSEVNEAQTKESEQHYEGPKILAILEEAGEQHAD